jgi:uncharacterized membrane protein YdcZ (DUF606 family)
VLQGQGDPQVVKAPSAGSPLNYQRELARQVAKQPFKASLIAFGVGAMVITLMRSAISRRKHQP